MLILVEHKLLLHQVKANSLIFYNPINLMILLLNKHLTSTLINTLYFKANYFITLIKSIRKFYNLSSSSSCLLIKAILK